MGNKLVYGYVYMFETPLSLRYRILVPVVFKDVSLPDDMGEAKKLINMQLRKLIFNQIENRMTLWDRESDEMVMKFNSGRRSDIPFEVLLYNLHGVELDKYSNPVKFAKNQIYSSVDEVRDYIIKHIDGKYDGSIYPFGVPYAPFIIDSSVLDSGNKQQISNDIVSFIMN